MANKTISTPRTIVEGREDWITVSGRGDDDSPEFLPRGEDFIEGVGVDGRPSGLLQKLKDYREGFRGTTARTRHGDFPQIKTNDQPMSRDGGGAAGGSASSGGSASGHVPTYNWYYYYRVAGKSTLPMNVFTGAPVYKTRKTEEGGELNYSLPENWELDFGEENFFTYDITKNGIDTFEWPFTSAIKGDRGTLSNWWAGCEPV